MNKCAAIAAGFIASLTLWSGAAPALAHGTIDWSVTIGTPNYYSPPPVVIYPQSQYIYGAPPSVTYVPPPVIYAPSYVQPPVFYQEGPPIVRYGQPYPYDNHAWREHHGRNHHQYNDYGNGQRPNWGYRGSQR